MRFSRIILALAASLSMASIAKAQVSGGIGWGPGSGPIGGVRPDPSPYDPVPGHPEDRGRREVYVGQYFRDQELDLISLLRLNQYNFQGARIQAVEVVLQATHRASLSLLANGYIVDQESFLSTYTTLIPNQSLYIGNNLRSLRLRVRDKLYIERIAVILEENNYPGYPPGQPGNPGGPNQIVLQGHINQTFMSPASIDLARVTALGSYRGYRIDEVRINGRSVDFNFSRARLMINGSIEGEVLLNGQLSSQSIYPRMTYIIGQNLNAMNLLVDRAQIGHVEVRLTRR